jgi:hypothetical protein
METKGPGLKSSQGHHTIHINKTKNTIIIKACISSELNQVQVLFLSIFPLSTEHSKHSNAAAAAAADRSHIYSITRIYSY